MLISHNIMTTSNLNNGRLIQLPRHPLHLIPRRQPILISTHNNHFPRLRRIFHSPTILPIICDGHIIDSYSGIIKLKFADFIRFGEEGVVDELSA